MTSLRKKLAAIPLLAYSLPFLVFLALTLCQGQFGEASRYWFYFGKTFLGAALVWLVWPLIPEMRWKLSWEAVGVGVAIFGVWVGLDGWYPSLTELFHKIGLGKAPVAELSWNPQRQFGEKSPVAWLIIITRIVGSSLVVPPLEEAFYRSFLYRYIVRPDFQSVSLGYFAWKPLLFTACIFGFSHYEWLPGILCGLSYQWLVLRKQRLGDAMTAHAITNFLLGVWVVWKGTWHFW